MIGKGVDLVRKNFVIACFFSLCYAVIFSLGIWCLLNLFSFAFAFGIDGDSAVAQYPRFFPFCIALGMAALLLLILFAFFNVKLSEKFFFSKKMVAAEVLLAFLLSLPLMKFWEAVFDFLRRVF